MESDSAEDHFPRDFANSLGLEPVRSHLVKWWENTTNATFLKSKASRRDTWLALLPVYAPLAMLAEAALERDLGVPGAPSADDWGAAFALNVVAALLLLLACQLPRSTLCTDFAVAAVYGMTILSRGVVLPSDPGVIVGVCEILATMAMASAGVHSTALLAFVAACVAEARRPELLVCAYVLLTAVLVEHRVSVLFSEREALNNSKYRSLKPRAEEEYLESSLPDGYTFSYASVPLSSVRSEPMTTLGAEDDHVSRSSSRSSLTDYMPWPVQATLTEAFFSRFASPASSPNNSRPPSAPPDKASRALGVPSRGPGAVPRPALTATVMAKPDASEHDPPAFPDSAFSSSAREGSLTGIPETAPLIEGPPVPPQAPPPPPAPPSPRNAEVRRSGSGSAKDVVASPPPENGEEVLRGIKLQGFGSAGLNVLFVEVSDPLYAVAGCRTYWATSGEYLLYYSPDSRRWCIASAKKVKRQTLQQLAQEGHSHDVARGPPEGDILERACKKDWAEWDSQANAWTPRPSAGVETLGRVRPPPTRAKSPGKQRSPPSTPNKANGAAPEAP